MRQLIVEPEFRDKIPALSPEEFSKLEENILADGEVRDPLVVWNNTIVDGHNRWAIIQKHLELKWSIKQMEFPDKWAAIAWMCRNQLGRRNLTEEQKSYLRGRQYDAEKMSKGGDRKSEDFSNGQNVRLKSRREQQDGTAGRIGIENGVDGRTIRRDADFANGLDAAETASPGIRDAVLSGEVKAPKSVIAEIRKLPEEKQKEAAEAIKRGEIETAKSYIRPIPKPEEEEEPEALTVAEFRELLDAAINNLDFALRMHLIEVHPEILDLEDGRRETLEALEHGIVVIKKYKKVVEQHG